MDILKWIQDQGYSTQAHEDMLPLIKEWGAWHRGKLDNFHSYKVWNGTKNVSQTKYSLGMAKMVAETYADLLLNEKVEYNIGDEQQTAVFGERFIDRVDFQKVANEGMELTMALGTGALILSLRDVYIDDNDILTVEEDSSFGLDFATADKIIPLTYSRQNVQDVAFYTNQSINGQDIVYVNIHKLEDTGYVVYNHYLIADEQGNVKELNNVADVLKEFHTHSDIPLFTIMRPNIVNTVDVDSPFGISVYHHAIDVLKGIDNAYDSFVNEFVLGRKRVFLNAEALKVDEFTGQPRFDPNDVVFYMLDGGYGDSDTEPTKMISESNMELRIDEHKEGIQLMLNLLSSSVGLGDGYYSFEKGSVMTATEVVSDNSELYRSIKKQELGLTQGLKELFRAVLRVGNQLGLLTLGEDLDITLDFDDSIIEDTEAIFNRALVMFNSQLIDEAEFFMITDKLTEEQAIEKVQARINRMELDEDIEEE